MSERADEAEERRRDLEKYGREMLKHALRQADLARTILGLAHEMKPLPSSPPGMEIGEDK